MGATTTTQEISCAYELCHRCDPILVQSGHRPRRFHDDACRQAQHRLLKARAECETRERALAQRWVGYLPETRQLLERALNLQGEEYARQFGAVIAKERHDALANSTLEERNAYLEITLARYCASVDPQDHARREQQFMAVGQLLGYPHLAKGSVGEGKQAWEEYLGSATEEMLAEAVTYGHEMARQAEDIRQYREENSRLGRAERLVSRLRKEQEHLQQRLAELERAMVVEAKRLADERTEALHEKHRRASLLIAELKKQLVRQAQEALVRVAELEASLYEEKQQQQRTDGALKDLKRQGRQRDRRHITALEGELRDYEQRCQYTQLTMLQLYLREDVRHVFHLEREGTTYTVITIDNQGTAMTENGAIQLTDAEIEQGRAYVVGQWEGPSTPMQQEALVSELLCSAATIQSDRRLAIIQEYLRSHPAAVIPIRRGDETHKVIAIGQVGSNVEAVTGARRVLRLDDEEIEQACIWAGQRLGNGGEQLYGDAARIAELEGQLERYRTLTDFNAPICPWTSLSVVQEYLRDSSADVTVRFKRQGKTIHILALDNQAVAVTRDDGLIRLSDVEIEQCRLYALRQLGRPVLASVRLPDPHDD